MNITILNWKTRDGIFDAILCSWSTTATKKKRNRLLSLWENFIEPKEMSLDYATN